MTNSASDTCTPTVATVISAPAARNARPAPATLTIPAAAIAAAPAERIADALAELRKIWPSGAACEHRHAAAAFSQLEALQADLRADAGQRARERSACEALTAIANANDNFCQNNGAAALVIRQTARQALGIPAAGYDREPVRPECRQSPEPEMPTSYTASKYRTSIEQELTVAAMRKFLVGGCMERDFTGPVYRCAMNDLGFIAHYDRRQFYATYFKTWEGAARFAEGIADAYAKRTWGAADRQEVKTAIYVLARAHGVRPEKVTA